MTSTVGAAPRLLRLERDEFLAAWRRLGLGDRPPLIDLPESAPTLSARAEADRVALRALAERGHARRGGPDEPRPVGDLAEALEVLARPALEVDVRRWTGPRAETDGWCAATSAGSAVLARPQDGGVVLQIGAPTADGPAALTALAASRLSDEPAAPGIPFTAPAAAVFAASPAGDRARHRLPRDVARRVEALRGAPPRALVQIGAGVWDRGRRRRVAPLTVVDTDLGRLLLDPNGETVRIRPIDRAGIARELARRCGP